MKTWLPATLVISLLAGAIDADEPDLARGDLDRLQGFWTRVSTEANGNKQVIDQPRPFLVVRDDGFSFGVDKDGKPLAPERVKLDPKAEPCAIDLTPTGDSAGPLKGKTYPGIYRIEGDTLTLCLSVEPGSPRPTKFATAGTRWLVDVYERAKPPR